MRLVGCAASLIHHVIGEGVPGQDARHDEQRHSNYEQYELRPWRPTNTTTHKPSSSIATQMTRK